MISRNQLLALYGVGASLVVLAACQPAMAETVKAKKTTKSSSSEISRLKDDMAQTVTAEQVRREAAEKELNSVRSALSDREMALSKLDAERAALMKQLEAERNAGGKARVQTQDTQGMKEMSARLNELEAKNTDLLGQVEAARARTMEAEKAAAQLSAGPASQAKMSELQARDQAEKTELKTLLETEKARREKLEQIAAQGASPDARLREMESRMGEMEKRNSDLQAALGAEKAKTNTALASREQQLSKQLDVMKSDNEMLAAKLATASSAPQGAAQTAQIDDIRKKADADRREFQALLEAEQVRRVKLEGMMAQGGNAVPSKESDAKIAELQKRNAELQQALDAGSKPTGEAVALHKQLDAMKSDNEMLAAKLAAASKTPQGPAQTAEIDSIRQKADADRRELQTLLAAEQARREKAESMIAQGGNNAAKIDTSAIDSKVAELQKRNADLEARLQSTGATPAQQDLLRQLDILKADNMALASKLGAGVAANNNTNNSGADESMVVAETKSSLASALAERDEYRNLLQRERLEKGEAKGAGKTDTGGLNAQIATLENEKAELIRKLEFARNGGTPASDDIDTRLAALEGEKANLKKQLDVAERDIISARTGKTASIPVPAAPVGAVSSRPVPDLKSGLAVNSGQSVPDADLEELLAENKKLQAEMQNPSSGKAPDFKALENEIVALRAQNSVLTSEVSKRLAAAPARATVDNAAAMADFKINEANMKAQQTVANSQKSMQTRYSTVESENIRLAQELAKARTAAAQAQAQPAVVQQVVKPVSNEQRMAAMESENMRLSQELAKARTAPKPVVTPIVAQAAVPMDTMAIVPPSAPAQAPYMPMQQAVTQQQPMVQMASYNPNSASAVSDIGPSGQDISGYLRRAGIGMVSGFEKVQGVSTADFAAFRWDTGVVFGTAEQQKMPNNKGFEQAINSYLSKTRNRCSGTFDQSFDASQVAANKNFAVADVACVMPDGTGAGAAVLFYYKDGMFNVVAHEGDIAQFDQAMATRDSLVRFMNGVL